MYLEAVLKDPASHGKEDEVGLIYFQGGPLDGHAYETATLLGQESLSLPVNQYVWTSEKKKSERTGMVAQVWKHQDLVPGAETTQSNGHAAVAPPGSPAQQPVTEVGSATATQVEGPAGPGTNVQEVAGTTPSDSSSPVPVGAQTASSGDLPTGDELFARRKALKLSVGAVVERCSLAHSKIGAIEKGVGKRVKESEIREYAEILAQLEAERGGAGAHS